jgi:anti-anti-sigma regulatory factor
MKLFLIVANGKHKGMPIAIKVDLFVIGADESCQLRSRLPGIGPHQCALVTRGNKVFIRDMDSGEPTLVNEDLLPPGEEWPLHAGDRLHVGPLEFVLRFRETLLSKRDMEEWALKSLDVDAEKETKEAEEDEYGRVKPLPRATTASTAAASILDRLQAKRGVVKGRLRIGFEGNIMTIRFNDMNLVEEAELSLVRKELFNNMDQATLRVLLDFKNVRKMSSIATDMIIDLERHLRAKGTRMAMCTLRPDLHFAFEARNLLQSIRLFPDKQTALTGHW